MSLEESSYDELTGRQKAAILLVALGREAAAQVMRQMNAREVEQVAFEIAELGNVPSELIEQVVAEFYENSLGKRRVQQAGMDYAREVLHETYGEQDGKTIMDKVVETIHSRSFRVLKHLDAGQLISFLRDEHPQTIALVLVHLAPRQASIVMAGLPEMLQGEVAYRMATLGDIAPGTIKTIERELEKHVSAIRLSASASGGPQVVVDLLHEVDRTTEESIIESIAEEDPDMAEQIRNMMFIFEDLVKLSDGDVRELMKEVEVRELAVSLKGASEEVREKIFSNMSKRAKEGLQEDMDYMGPVRIADVEQSQQSLLAVLHRLEEDGTVTLSGGEDQLVS